MNHASAAYSEARALARAICLTPTEVQPEILTAPDPIPATRTRADMLAIIRPAAIDRGIVWCRNNVFRRYRIHDLRDLADAQLRAILADAEDAAKRAA